MDAYSHLFLAKRDDLREMLKVHILAEFPHLDAEGQFSIDERARVVFGLPQGRTFGSLGTYDLATAIRNWNTPAGEDAGIPLKKLPNFH
jgi:hypothetical protein